ncbi:hypothetical protein [Marinobacter sp. ATCH36]|uniref:hypothetical protein n=1 Tax=Marinobacter sp. ATCH36 TaxID=2945106 RepID=UPI002021C75F|nr:hypothetical protein [Marinobacter sp. ATCH36]MCL7943793.1 hypothetical protein [Marinobacter sp. ATCH36]
MIQIKALPELTQSGDTLASLFLFDGRTATRLTGTTTPLDGGSLSLTHDSATTENMRFIFNSRQEQIHRDFILQFRAFEHQLNPDPAGQSTGGLKVVDQHVFEDWLELQMVATGLANEHANTLFALNQLLNRDLLAGGLRAIDLTSMPAS